MRIPLLALLLAGLAGAAAAQQTLVCPTVPAGRPCDAFHYHVQMYRPDTKQFVEVYGVNEFATQAACDRGREREMATNTAIVEHFRTIKQQYEGDRFGPCHCDMTGDRAAPNFLSDAQRTAQFRTAEEVRLRVRERLLDEKVSSDSPLVRGLWAAPVVTPLLAGPKLVAPPPTVPAPVLTATEDLLATRTIDTAKPIVAALDLPLADIEAPDIEAPPSAAVPATGAVTVTPPAAGTAPATDAATPAATRPAEPPTEEVVVAPPPQTEPAPAVEAHVESTVPEEDTQSAEETAEKFISYETQRIQNVLRAAGAIADEEVKSKIFEACMQRIQLLSNLRLLIEGSGMRSRLAAAARDAETEPQRLALIGRLFGDEVRPHWAPKDAADVIFEVEPDVAAAPERALRDTTGRVAAEQKKRALYLMLAQTQPTEDQRLWLSGIVEGFLR
jgi:hypothetical protein